MTRRVPLTLLLKIVPFYAAMSRGVFREYKSAPPAAGLCQSRIHPIRDHQGIVTLAVT